MMKRLVRRELWTQTAIAVVLLCAHFLAPCGFLTSCELLAQSSQLNSTARPEALPEIVSNVVSKEAPNGVKDKHTPVRFLGDRLPDKPTIAPSFTIPVTALGFTAPVPRSFGQQISLASLDFLGDGHILFTFRVPGLIRREAAQNGKEDERQIQAVVLDVKTGRVEAEALWTVHDYLRYLWMLKDGHFLLRDRDGLQQGDSSLVLKPLLQFPGPVAWLEMDPQQLYMVTNSHEPAKVEARPGQVSSPPTAAATIAADDQNASAPADKADSAPPDTVVRIFERSTGKVMLVSRTRSTVHLPINAGGYLEALRGNGPMWVVNLSYFTGGSRIVGRVDSTCSPVYDFVSQSEFLVKACASGGNRLVAFTTDGRRLWEDGMASSEIWPITVASPDGSRLARETLQASRPVNPNNALDLDDVKGQWVRIINAADGNVALEATANPPLDAGGNVAISPTGRRVAILIDGAIQVFELPPAPALPGPTTAPAAG
jgi:hypothetical protein